METEFTPPSLQEKGQQSEKNETKAKKVAFEHALSETK